MDLLTKALNQAFSKMTEEQQKEILKKGGKQLAKELLEED